MTDLQLVEAMQGEDLLDRTIATNILTDRYYEPLVRVASRKLTRGERVFAHDVVTDSIFKFTEWVRTKEDKVTNVKSYLGAMVRNACIDKLRQTQFEVSFENDVPLDIESSLAMSEASIKATDDPLTAICAWESSLEQQMTVKLAVLLQYAFNRLSPCQRVAWILRKLYQYSPGVVARLMDKHRRTIDTHFHYANSTMSQYYRSKSFHLDYASQELRELEGSVYRSSLSQPAFVVERFAEHINPHLTPDELQNTSFTFQEYQTDFNISLAFLRDRTTGRPIESDSIFLILTRKSQLTKVQKMDDLMELISSEQYNMSAFHKLDGNWRHMVPNETLLPLDVRDDNIVVTSQRDIMFFPETYPEDGMRFLPVEARSRHPELFLAWHSRSKIVPIEQIGLFSASRDGDYLQDDEYRWIDDYGQLLNGLQELPRFRKDRVNIKRSVLLDPRKMGKSITYQFDDGTIETWYLSNRDSAQSRRKFKRLLRESVK